MDKGVHSEATNGRTVIVVGDGIVGLACAWHLQRAGMRTTVIGPAAAETSAAWGSAGHLAVEQVEPLASRKAIRLALGQLCGGAGPIRVPFAETARWLPFFLRLAAATRERRVQAGTAALAACMRRAAPAWRALLSEIGQPRLLLECGHFVVWESRRSASAGAARWRGTNTGTATFREATAEERERLQALVRRPLWGAIRFAQTGQFSDPGILLSSLEEAIRSGGGSRVADIVTRVDGAAATVHTAGGGRHEADAVVIAAGVRSGALLARSGLFAPLIAERGYHIRAASGYGATWPDDMPPVVFEDRSLIVSRFSSGLRASGFLEFARPDRRADSSRWQVLREHMTALGLPFEGEVAHWMGSRPTLPDYLPAIGRSPGVNNLYYAFGHQHLGVTLAAVTAELLRDLIVGNAPAVDLRPFDLARFR